MSTQERWRQVDRVLGRALELEGAERGSFLDRACAGDDALRQEVEGLLAIDAAPHPLLDGSAWAPGDGAGPGEQVGLYRLRRRIGEGGMGVVYFGTRDDGQYERGVAIKVLKAGMLTRAGLGRFRNECRILARLEHHGIARLYDAGTTPEGLPYLVMEHVEGIPLDVYARRSGGSLKQRLRLFLGICRAVSHAHQHLIVHRDLKPSNILVTADGRPKLLDFGIAKVVDESAGAERSDWTVGTAPMTPRYASPEQAEGSQVTTATDVYALGLILAELTGVPVGDREAGGREPAPDALGTLPVDLRAIVLRATARSAADRYRSAEQLSAEIERFLTGLPVRARAPSRLYRLGRFVGRHRIGVGLGAGLFAVVAASAVGLARLAGELAQERDRARIEASIAAQATDFMVELFAESEPGQRTGAEPTASEMLDRGARRIADAIEPAAASAPVRSALLAAIGRAYHALSRYDRAAEMLSERLVVARTGLASGDPRLASAQLDLAEAEADRSDFGRAEALAREALRSLAAGAASAGERSRAQRVLGEVLARKGDLASAEPWLRAAAETDRALFGAASEQAGVSQVALAGLAFQRRDAEASETHCRLALAAFRSSLGEEHPRTLAVLGDLAVALQNQGRLDLAERAYRDLLARQRRVFGKAHDRVADTLNSLGTTFYDQGDLAGAEREMRASLAMLRSLTAEPTVEIAGVITNLARVLREAGRTAEAVALYREALGIFRLRLDPGSPSLGAPLTFLGGALCAQGKVIEGEPYLDEARDIYLAALGPEHYRLALLEGTRARCLARRGRVDEALALLDSTLPVVAAQFGDEHSLTLRIRARREAIASGAGCR